MTSKKVCKVSTGEVFVKIMEKMVQVGLGTGARLFWEVLVQFPAMGRGKPIENGQTGVRESFLGMTLA